MGASRRCSAPREAEACERTSACWRRSEPRLLRWEQELEGTPFERLLAQAETAIELTPADGGAATTVAIELRQRLLGWSRLTPFLFKRAARRQLAEALAGLDEAVVGG